MISGPSVHPTAQCDGAAIARGASVEAFATIAPDCVVENDVRVRVGARLLTTHVGARSDIGPNAVLGGPGPPCKLGPDVVVGANATVLPGASVGRGAVISPGSVVTDPVPANAVVRGNPARIVGYVGGDPDPPSHAPPATSAEAHSTRVSGARTETMMSSRDLRGSLMAAEFTDLPFLPTRLFTVFGVPGEHIRGSHAHRECTQFLICVSGTVNCLVDDGDAREEILLDDPCVGLLISPLVWGTQYKYSRDAVLLVLASHSYDAGDYIRDYDEFLQIVRSP